LVSGETFIAPLRKVGGRGLRWEILVSLGLIMFSGVLFMGVTALKAAERAIFLQKIESLAQVTRSLQMGMAVRWEREPAGDLQYFVTQSATAIGVASFKVADTSGRLVAGLRSQELGTITRDPFLLRALDTGSIVRQSEIEGGVPDRIPGSWVLAAPVFPYPIPWRTWMSSWVSTGRSSSPSPSLTGSSSCCSGGGSSGGSL
jgi:hypothetical protein